MLIDHVSSVNDDLQMYEQKKMKSEALPTSRTASARLKGSTLEWIKAEGCCSLFGHAAASYGQLWLAAAGCGRPAACWTWPGLASEALQHAWLRWLA
jgi:hypothetical protein